MKSYIIVIIFFLLNIVMFSQNSTWFNNGPDGGSVNCVSVSKSNPNIVYIGTMQGIYKSENKGISWIKTSFGKYEVSCIGVSPISSDIAIAGTIGGGIWRTTNGGIDWMFAGLNNITINCIAIDPNNTDNIYCGNGDYFTGGECGIFKSSNGGESFNAIIEWDRSGQAGLAQVNGILIDPENSDNVYVAGATNGYSSSFGAFLYSIDGGLNWINKKITTSSIEGIINIAVVKNSAGQKVAYAMERPANDPWGYPSFYKTSDLGDNWEPVDGPYSSNYEPNLFIVDPNNPNDIYIGARSYATQILVYKTDQDQWDVIPGTGLPSNWSTCIGVSSETTPTIYLGNYYGGIYNFTTGVSSQWSQIVNGINATYITDIAVHPSSPDLAYACIKDENRLFKTVDGGENWSRITGSSPNLIAIDPQNKSLLYAAESDQDGSNYYIYKSSNSGTNWQQLNFLSCSGSDCSTKLTDILIHPTNSQNILVASRLEYWSSGPKGFGIVARTTDGGNSWDELFSASSSALAIDPNNPDIVYSGKERSGQIWKIENAWGIANTTEITPSQGMDDITDIELDNNSNVYVSTSSGLWRYTEGNWTELTLPSSVITSIAIDRNITPNIIYTATGDNGVFISNDGGSTWNIWNDGLKNLSITKLKIGGSKVWVGTEYGGVWCRNTAQSISPPYITHNTGDYRISIFQDGSFGHLSSLNTIGEGCQYNNNVDALYASGLIFGTQSAGFVNGNQASFQIVNELANTEPINEVTSSVPELDQISQTTYNDNSAIIPYEVSVRQKAFSDTGDEFVILEFGFTPVFSSLDNFYAGIFADWDVGGSEGYPKNLGGYDQSRSLAYQYVADGSPDPCYYGIVALNGMAGAMITTEGGAMRETALQRISTFENSTITEMGDYRMWIGSGPFNLIKNSSRSVYFAFVAGTDLENLKTNTDAAIQKYQNVITDVQDAKDLPLQFNLSQNYPNPFNPSTIISYSIPKQSNVTLKVFDVLGREVKTLTNKIQLQGDYKIELDGSEFTSGIYFYRLMSGNIVETKKMILLK